ncbi:hypothetical protein KFU94_68770 [Chloroflexi bacterium TSY]|nr:hypothetical protein [Chloroflexi bacterium TSY]
MVDDTSQSVNHPAAFTASRYPLQRITAAHMPIRHNIDNSSTKTILAKKLSNCDRSWTARPLDASNFDEGTVEE